MIERPATPHFLRFVRALAFVSGATSLAACASTAGADDVTDVTAYDGASHGIAPSVDAGISVMPDAADAYDGGPVGLGVGVMVVDAGHD